MSVVVFGRLMTGVVYRTLIVGFFVVDRSMVRDFFGKLMMFHSNNVGSQLFKFIVPHGFINILKCINFFAIYKSMLCSSIWPQTTFTDCFLSVPQASESICYTILGRYMLLN